MHTGVPEILIHPENGTELSAGGGILVYCVVHGVRGTVISWSEGGRAVVTDPHINIFTELIQVEGAPFLKSILDICKIREVDGGDYSCTAANLLGNDSFSITVDVIAAEGKFQSHK